MAPGDTLILKKDIITSDGTLHVDDNIIIISINYTTGDAQVEDSTGKIWWINLTNTLDFYCE